MSLLTYALFYYVFRNIGKIRNLLSYDACSTIIHALISCRLDYCNSILYNVPKSKTDRLQRIQNQCARILTKSPRREHITPVLMKLHWLKIQDRIIYKLLMLTYKSYYNMAPPYLCELINKKESHMFFNQIMILMFCIFRSLIGTDMTYHFSVDVPLRI